MIEILTFQPLKTGVNRNKITVVELIFTGVERIKNAWLYFEAFTVETFRDEFDRKATASGLRFRNSLCEDRQLTKFVDTITSSAVVVPVRTFELRRQLLLALPWNFFRKERSKTKTHKPVAITRTTGTRNVCVTAVSRFEPCDNRIGRSRTDRRPRRGRCFFSSPSVHLHNPVADFGRFSAEKLDCRPEIVVGNQTAAVRTRSESESDGARLITQ